MTVLTSSVAFIEPSPHDLLMGVLALTCVAAGVRFPRMLTVPLLLLVIWNIAGIMALFPVVGQDKTIQYTGTSIYLAVAALVFACLFANNTMPRLATMRIAYTISAIMVAFAGISGYFGLFPGAEQHFAPFGRALGSFKDPNVFGPFLIWPIMFVVYRMLTRHIRLADLAVSGILLFALLLSFSRGAWFHFAVSSLVLVGLAFLTAPSQQVRLRIFGLSALSLFALAAILVALLSFESIGAMFRERAQLIQSYDVGEGGRFRLQELALSSALNFPNGMGPLEFARVHGLQQHNVYLQAFLVYGWTGAMAYLLLLFSTLWVGVALGPRANVVASLCDHRFRGIRRRSGGRLRDRQRSLAPLLLVARNDLGPGRCDVQAGASRARSRGRRLGGQRRSQRHTPGLTTSCRAGSAGAGRRPACARSRNP